MTPSHAELEMRIALPLLSRLMGSACTTSLWAINLHNLFHTRWCMLITSPACFHLIPFPRSSAMNRDLAGTALSNDSKTVPMAPAIRDFFSTDWIWLGQFRSSLVCFNYRPNRGSIYESDSKYHLLSTRLSAVVTQRWSVQGVWRSIHVYLFPWKQRHDFIPS